MHGYISHYTSTENKTVTAWIHTGQNMYTKFTPKLNSVSRVITEETTMWYSPGNKHHLTRILV